MGPKAATAPATVCGERSPKPLVDTGKAGEAIYP